jgi:hypothetical protein
MKTRRGLSTVIGTVFAIIALTTTITYVTYSMNTLDKYNQSSLLKNQQLTDISKEKFQISGVTIPNNKLNITVTNTGSLPINFTKIWIQNTTTTDWVKGYVPTNNFVVPGGTLTNIGKTLPVYINSANSYNIKLVTSRGNTQQFTVNSVGVQPLNIQLLAFPTTVPSGFKSELVMVVINNSTSTLVNISPNNPTLTINNVANDSPTCTSSGLTPAQYTTISPGTTAIFTWDITVTGSGGDTCTASFTTPLQGGYAQTLTSPAIKPTAVSLSSTTYSQNSGVITNDYTSFKWTQGGNKWNNEWSLPSNKITDFQATISNNNQTAGGYSLWLSKNSQIMLFQTIMPANQKLVVNAYFLSNCVTITNGAGCGGGPNCPTAPCVTAYTDYSASVANQGGITTLYFGADGPGSGNEQPTLLQPNTPYFGMIILYGKFCMHSGDNNCGNYAQTIPFLAVISN